MRNAFMERLMEKVEEDDSIFLVVGDLGYTVVDAFAEKYPERFLNAGVAEQNMTGVACGLAREGHKVFTYSIGNFTTLRCLEQIRNGICYHELPVCVVSVGGGFMYGYLGPTHHLTEDIGIMRTLPNMRVFVPFCKASARRVLDEVLEQPGPAYVRLGREGEAVEQVADNGLTPVRAWGGGPRVGGAGRAVISVGKMSREVFEWADREQADLFALCRVSPLPEEQLRGFFERYREVTVIEDHQARCGVHSALSEFTSGLKGVNLANRFSPVVDGEDGQRNHMLFRPQPGETAGNDTP
jgi:transketolase